MEGKTEPSECDAFILLQLVPRRSLEEMGVGEITLAL